MIFLDTSYLVAFANELDVLHARAVLLAHDIDSGKYGSLALSDYVFGETASIALMRTKNLEKTVGFLRKIRNTATLLRTDGTAFDETVKAFEDQKDASLSFVDCNIIVLCRSNGINFLATFDAKLKTLSRLKIVD